MALFTTLLIALSPLIQQDPAPKPPEPVVSSPTPGGAAAIPGARALPASPPAPPESAQGNQSESYAGGGKGLSTTSASPALASWYPKRPATCDGLPVPWWVKQWTANLTLPCGSLVTLSGPAGTVTVPVEDRGPEAWTGRLFDLNPAAFGAVAGSLSTGVVAVEWSPAG